MRAPPPCASAAKQAGLRTASDNRRDAAPSSSSRSSPRPRPPMSRWTHLRPRSMTKNGPWTCSEDARHGGRHDISRDFGVRADDAVWGSTMPPVPARTNSSLGFSVLVRQVPRASVALIETTTMVVGDIPNAGRGAQAASRRRRRGVQDGRRRRMPWLRAAACPLLARARLMSNGEIVHPRTERQGTANGARRSFFVPDSDRVPIRNRNDRRPVDPTIAGTIGPLNIVDPEPRRCAFCLLGDAIVFVNMKRGQRARGAVSRCGEVP